MSQEGTYGRIVASHILGLLELRKDRLRQDLAELDTHLIEGVDAPDDALGEDLVLVERNERAERCRGHLREEDAVAGTVAREDLRLDQCVRGVGAELLADLFFGLTEGQRLGLSEEVAQENAVVLGVRNRVMRRCGREEVGRDEFCALVNKLVERVLSVGTRSAPDDRLSKQGLFVRHRKMTRTK